jgi:hypothetical protein
MTKTMATKARARLDELLGKLLERALPTLPAIEGCDPWELTSRVYRGRTRYTLTIACSERRRNGGSNHAFAEIWYTDNTMRCAWSHGQGHHYEPTPGSNIYGPLDVKFVKTGAGTWTIGENNIMYALDIVLSHVRKYARRDADIYVIC